MVKRAHPDVPPELIRRECKLVYYPDDRPGIRRRRQGRGFSYIAPDGTRITDPDERQRLNALAVPPAYEDVWICPLPEGHLQATGLDVRLRKQYRYHPDWTEWRARRKFDDLVPFGMALPRLRRRVTAALAGEAGDKTFAVAAVVALLDRAAMRIGHRENVELNGTHGATTLTSRHLSLGEGEIRLNYTAKGGRKVRQTLRDRRLNKVFHDLDDLPGKELMTWLDADGNAHTVHSEDVNDFIAETVDSEGATAKTFRTWAGTVTAFEVATDADKFSIRQMAEAAAERLSNTPTIARSSYIHPDVIDLVNVEPEARRALAELPSPVSGLRKSEGALLAFLAN